MIPRVYIGYDFREDEAANVLKYSIKKYASGPVQIIFLKQEGLRRAGLYRRTPHVGSTVWGNEKHMRDSFDEKNYSTEFSFTRFLCPILDLYEKNTFSLFLDCDMLFQGDVYELWEKYATEDAPPVRCVHHKYEDGGGLKSKMYGCPQTKYSRKNWSSVVFWNSGHESNKNLTVDDISTKSGSWLHNFKWLKDEEVGSLPEKWNWLDGKSDENILPINIHYTSGGPWFEAWKPLRKIDKVYADLWEKEKDLFLGEK